MRYGLQAVIEFHKTEPYCNVGLTRVQYGVRWLCSEKQDKFTDGIKPNSLIALERNMSTCW